MEYTCEHCDSEVRLGNETIHVQRGVIGPRGFVPFEEDTMFFCNEECLVRFFDQHSVETLQRRIP
jgi:hypothetical protein